MMLDHIALIISKEENLEFYKKLGFKIIERIERPYDVVVIMECGGVVLEIFIDSNHPERMSKTEAKGLRHIAFTVDALDDVYVECGPIKTNFKGRRFAFTRDPDGQPIELIEK